jgi:hypothetical protein
MDALLSWPIVETKARLAVISVAWALGVALVFHQHQTKQRHGSAA